VLTRTNDNASFRISLRPTKSSPTARLELVLIFTSRLARSRACSRDGGLFASSPTPSMSSYQQRLPLPRERPWDCDVIVSTSSIPYRNDFRLSGREVQALVKNTSSFRLGLARVVAPKSIEPVILWALQLACKYRRESLSNARLSCTKSLAVPWFLVELPRLARAAECAVAAAMVYGTAASR
jgi:hypothetical protein